MNPCRQVPRSAGPQEHQTSHWSATAPFPHNGPPTEINTFQQTGPLMCFMCLWFMWIWIKERSALAAVHSWVQSIYSRGAFGGKEQVTFIKYHLFMHILNIVFLRAKINVNRQCSMQIVYLSLIVCVSHCCCHISSHVSILALEMAVSVGWLVDPLSRLQTFGLVFQRES